MKILHVYRDLLLEGGVPYQTRRLAAAQAKLGEEIGVISLPGKDLDFLRIISPDGSLEITTMLSRMWKIREFLQRWKPEIAHIAGLWIPVHQFCALEIFRAGIPYVITTHGHLSPLGTVVRFGGKKQNPFHIWRKNVWHWIADLPLLKHAADVLVHSRYEAEVLEGFGVKNISVLPIGIDSNSECGYNSRPRELHDPITFLHLGRLDIYHKGLDLICEALQKLSHLAPDKKFKVIFVGPTVGHSRKKLQEYARTLGKGILEIRDAIWGEDREKLWQEVDYFFNVYRFAGMALSPSEAVARGLPLVASREGNFGDWVEACKMGFVVPLDSSAISNMLLSILEISGREYQQLSQNALNFSQGYTWEKVAQDSLAVYRKTVEINP